MKLSHTQCLLLEFSLVFYSLYASESCLQVFDKLAHGSVILADQIAFWWCVYRQIRSREVQYSSKLFTEEHLVIDNFFDFNTLNNYDQEFRLVFNQIFGEFPDSSLKYYSRYQRGLIMYHSMSYNRRHNCDSYSVCVKNETDPMKLSLWYGQILFFFYIQNEPFFFFKRYANSKRTFSSIMKPIEDIPNWNFYIDKYYQIIRHCTSELVIFPCSFILCKCIFVRLDESLSICTPIELETEHD